jgi:hypothetical protein
MQTAFSTTCPDKMEPLAPAFLLGQMKFSTQQTDTHLVVQFMASKIPCTSLEETFPNGIPESALEYF